MSENLDFSSIITLIMDHNDALGRISLLKVLGFIVAVIVISIVFFAVASSGPDSTDGQVFAAVLIAAVMIPVGGIGIGEVITKERDHLAARDELATEAWSTINASLHERYNFQEAIPKLDASRRDQEHLSDWVLKTSVPDIKAPLLIVTNDGEQLLWTVSADLETGEATLLTSTSYAGTITPRQLQAGADQ